MSCPEVRGLFVRDARRPPGFGRFLLVGEAPGTLKPGERPEPLWPTSRVGRRIMELCSLDTNRDYLRVFDRVNLCQVPAAKAGRSGFAFNAGFAAEAAAGLLTQLCWQPHRYEAIILLGRRVHKAVIDGAFRLWPELPMEVCMLDFFEPAKLHESLTIVLIPHPSGTSRWWNSRENRLAAKGFMTLMLAAAGALA